jgi:hypothetical protein
MNAVTPDNSVFIPRPVTIWLTPNLMLRKAKSQPNNIPAATAASAPKKRLPVRKVTKNPAHAPEII